MPDREIEVMIEAASRVPGIAFDLYLTHNSPSYVKELRELATATGNGHIRILDPVPYDELIATLNRYDIGFYSIPPVSFNQKHSLPNKFFDFIQARLALAIGPSIEMSSIVESKNLGNVAESFDASSLSAMLKRFTHETVTEFKSASHANARDLSAESQIAVWDRKIAAISARLAGGR